MRILWALILCLWAVTASAQTFQLPNADTPLSGNEFVPIDQVHGNNFRTVKATVSEMLRGAGNLPSPWVVTPSNLEIGPGQFVNSINLSRPSDVNPLPIWFTSYNQLLLGEPFKQLPWITCDPTVSWTFCVIQGPALRTYGDLCCGDIESFGALDSRQLQGVQYGVRLTGAQPGGPTSLLSSEGSPQTDIIGGAHIEVYPDCVSCGGPGPLRLATIDSILSGGVDYVVGDTVVLDTGASCSIVPVARIYTVNNSGAVTGVTIDRGQGGICTGTPTNPISQTSTSGSGTGLAVNATFSAPPYVGEQGAVQFIAYNSAPGGHQQFHFLARSAPSTLSYVAKLTEEGFVVGPTPLDNSLPEFNGVSKSRILSEGDLVVQIPPGGGNGAANLWFSTGTVPAVLAAAITVTPVPFGVMNITNYSQPGVPGDIVLNTIDGGGIPVEQLRVFAGGGIRINNQMTVANLPTCNPANLGNVQVVTNSNTATWGATIGPSTGAFGVLAWCNAANWKVVGQ